MKLQLRNLVLLAGIIAISQARYHHRRAPDERCTGLADALEGFINSFPSYVGCMVSRFSTSILGIDIGSRATIEEVACLITDNSASGTAIFNALDNAGYIDKVIEAAYGYAAVMGKMAAGELIRQGLNMELRECSPPSNNYYNPDDGILSSLEPADFQNLYDVAEELQLWNLSPELTKKIQTLAGMFMFARESQPGFSEPCICSAITDPEQRCSMLTAATRPFIDAIAGDERAMGSVMRLNGYIQQFTGVNLLGNFSSAMEKMSCDVAKAAEIGDYRTMLENYGLLSVGFDLGVGFACVGLQSNRRWSQRTIDRFENPDEDDPYYWRPSQERVDQARAMINLADAWLDAGLDQTQLDVPMMAQGMIQGMCRRQSAYGSTPSYY